MTNDKPATNGRLIKMRSHCNFTFHISHYVFGAPPWLKVSFANANDFFCATGNRIENGAQDSYNSFKPLTSYNGVNFFFFLFHSSFLFNAEAMSAEEAGAAVLRSSSTMGQGG